MVEMIPSLAAVLFCFLLTAAVELLAAELIGIPAGRWYREILLMNAVTNIPANIGIRLLYRVTGGGVRNWLILLFLHEAGIFLLETGFIALLIRERRVPAWAASLAMNLSSFLCGMVIGLFFL